MTIRRLRLWLLAFLITLLVACGGGSDTGPGIDGELAADPQAATVKSGKEASAPVALDLNSSIGDYIGQGRTYHYTKANAIVAASYAGGVIRITVQGQESWDGYFQVPGAPTRLKNATYRNLGRYPFAKTGMSWTGEGRGCNTLVGSFSLTNVVYTKAGVLDSFDLRFEQFCDGSQAALTGTFHWNANDPTTFAGPMNPPPADLWKPDAGATPTSGRYIYLQSEAGDYIGGGQTNLYTGANAVLSMTGRTGGVQFGVNGIQWWTGNFQAMQSLTQLQPGYYGSLQRYPFHNPAVGGLDWSGEGRGCNTLTGWFVVDSVSYVNGALAAIKLRFEQHCEGTTPALRGEINWTATDTSAPAGPVNPPPADLWKPAAGATPDTGNFTYLQSDAGDYIGGGQTYLYTPANATLSGSSSSGQFSIGVSGWYGDFKAMSTLTELQPGYYGDLSRYPFHNPATGGLSWSGNGRGCNTLTGWFVVDEVTYFNAAITAISLRFEQHCEGGTPALRGQIRWQQQG